MRAVFVGSSSLARMTTRLLLKRDHEVVIIETDKSKIESLSDTLDCGFLHGDGSKPAILREADAKQTDILFCLTGDDRTNIIASLVGRSLGFARTVTKIVDPELEHICIELGLEDTIIPARTIGRYLADMFEGRDPMELSTMIRDKARVFSFVAREDDELKLNELSLPKTSRVACLYRDGKLVFPMEESKLKKDDEVIIITDRENLTSLKERWTTPTPPSKKT